MTLEGPDYNGESPANQRQMRLSMIAAVTRNGLIGINNRLPVRLPADMRRFRIITSNRPVIMGRKTHESIGRCLPTRTNIVLTHNERYQAQEGAVVVHDLAAAWQAAYDTGATHAFVIGGAEVFRNFLPVCSKFYLTILDQEMSGDTYFPIPVEELMKWDGKLVQSFEPSPTNVVRQKFYILDVPDVDSLASLYEKSTFNGAGVA